MRSRRSDAPSPYRNYPPRKQTWPPSPSVEDEAAAQVEDGGPPTNTRGTVDQESIIEDIAQPADRRYVLVSDPGDSHGISSVRDRRRKSFAERGNMDPINTRPDDPPVYTKRVSTPYAYTRPQKETTLPSPMNFLSPVPVTPGSSSASPSAPTRDVWNAQNDQNAKPSKPHPSYTRHDSFPKSSQAPKTDVFDDSDNDMDDTTHLRTAERKPARYSFVKSDLQKEDLRTGLHNSQPKPGPRRSDAGQRPPPLRRGESSTSSKDNPYAQSPRSSTSSLNSGTRKSKPTSLETTHYSSSRPPSRPSSPLQRAPSPKLPARLHESPPSSRPSSKGNTRPASPLSSSSTLRPASPGLRRVPVADADWHSTYPPFVASDRSRPPSRYGRHETMPVQAPRIDVRSPSRAPVAASALPYPVDNGPIGVFMPSEEHYQFDHATVASPRQGFSDSPGFSSSPILGVPRRDEEARGSKNKSVMLDQPTRTRNTIPNSARSQVSPDHRREPPPKTSAKLDVNKPLPSCPRSAATAKYDDWFNLKGHRHFNICPSCYDEVFADTPFAVQFSQSQIGERPIERICDFSSPWTRLAWLLTIKQRRPSLDLLNTLAEVAEVHRPCPDDRAVGSDRATWYGIPDQRDGVHVANFAICSSDKKMIEVMFPTMRGYFTKLSSASVSKAPEKYMCSLRTSSRRFPKYLDLLVELDTEAQDLSQRPNINRFVQMARDNAFKGECAKDKTYLRKPWHFIPSLPEFTVCEECYDEFVWPLVQSKTMPSTIPRLFNKAIQLVPNEDPIVGSSCCLYSPRMRKVWETSVKEEDFTYLETKVLERKRVEARLARAKKGLMTWMGDLDRDSTQWETAKSELKSLDRDWLAWE
jgi:hypothetical protein